MYYLKSIALAGIFLLFHSSYAQPSDATIKARAMQDGAKTVKFIGDGDLHQTISETYYIRTFEGTWDTQYPGVTQRVRIEYKYNKSGGSWNFTKEFIVESLYDGIPNPTESEIMAMINTDRKKFLGGSYTDIVGDVEYIKIAPKPRWMWDDVTRVSVDMECMYSKKMSSTEVSKCKQIHTITMYADEFKGPWKRFIASKRGYPDILSTQTYSAEEIRNMKTLYDIDLDNEAAALMADLPKISIPEFKNEKEAIVHTFKLLREGNYPEFKAYMYEMMGPRYFHDNSKVLNSSGERMWEDAEGAFDPKHPFKDQYCEHPTLKTDDDQKIEFYNRAKRQFSRIVVRKVDGKFKITDLSIGYHVQTAEITRVTGFGDQNCGEPVKTEKDVIPTREIGSRVEVSANGRWYPGTVMQADPVFEGRYQVKRDDGKTLWYSHEYIRAGGGSSSNNSVASNNNSSNSNSNTNSNGSSNSNSVAPSGGAFKIGDKVEVTYKNQKHIGTIEKVDGANSNRYFVRTTTMSSLWHNSDVLAPAPEESNSNDETKPSEEEKKKKKIDTNKAGGLKNRIKKIGG